MMNGLPAIMILKCGVIFWNRVILSILPNHWQHGVCIKINKPPAPVPPELQIANICNSWKFIMPSPGCGNWVATDRMLFTQIYYLKKYYGKRVPSVNFGHAVTTFTTGLCPSMVETQARKAVYKAAGETLVTNDLKQVGFVEMGWHNKNKIAERLGKIQI